jgi:hypothetical protein
MLSEDFHPLLGNPHLGVGNSQGILANLDAKQGACAAEFSTCILTSSFSQNIVLSENAISMAH